MFIRWAFSVAIALGASFSLALANQNDLSFNKLINDLESVDSKTRQSAVASLKTFVIPNDKDALIRLARILDSDNFETNEGIRTVLAKGGRPNVALLSHVLLDEGTSRRLRCQ